MFNLVNNEGKPLSTEGIDDKVVELIKGAVGGLGHQVTAAMSTSIKNATKPLETSIAGITESITKLGDGKGGDPAGTPSDRKDTDPDDPVMKMLGELSKTVTGLESKFGEQQSTSAAEARGRAYLKKHCPNLKPEQAEVVLAQIVSARPEDDEAVKQVVEGVRDTMTKFNPEIGKAFSADPVQEDGESGKASQDNFDKEAAIEELEKAAAERAGK